MYPFYKGRKRKEDIGHRYVTLYSRHRKEKINWELMNDDELLDYYFRLKRNISDAGNIFTRLKFYDFLEKNDKMYLLEG